MDKELTKAWTSSQVYYAMTMLYKSGQKWHVFAGRCFLAGMCLGYTKDQICEYLFETYHQGEHITHFRRDDVVADMKLYFTGTTETPDATGE